MIRVRIITPPVYPENGNHDCHEPSPACGSRLPATIEIPSKIPNANPPHSLKTVAGGMQRRRNRSSSIKCGGITTTFGNILADDNITYLARSLEKQLVGISAGDSGTFCVPDLVDSTGTPVTFEENDTVKVIAASTGGGSGDSSGSSFGSGKSSGVSGSGCIRHTASKSALTPTHRSPSRRISPLPPRR